MSRYFSRYKTDQNIYFSDNEWYTNKNNKVYKTIKK